MSTVYRFFLILLLPVLLNACKLTVINEGGGTVQSEPGVIDCGDICTASFNEQTEIILAAVPDPGYEFAGWQGACEGDQSCELVLSGTSGNKSVTASFTFVGLDSDGDGVLDDVDMFPDDPGEWNDFDEDGVGDNADTDDDADGFPDGSDPFPLDSDRPQWVKAVHHEIPSDGSNAYFALSVDGLGDVNGDGFDDFIVGRKPRNQATVFSGFDATPIITLEGSLYSNFGEIVHSIGDISNDGIHDYAVSAPIKKTVFVYSGATGSQLFEWVGGYSYGEAMAPAGDINNDGIPDVVIGAPMETIVTEFSEHQRAGSVEVRSGADGAVLHRIEGSAANGYLGRSVTGLGDINSDGYADFAIKQFSSSTSNQVGIYIYSGKTGTILRTIVGNYGSVFGRSLANLGDIDGDGFNDLGVAHTEGSTADNGYVAIISSQTGDWISSKTGEPYSRAGYGIEPVNDHDGDGTNDFLMSLHQKGNGKAWLVSGATNETLFEFIGDPADDGYGYALGYAGDVNGDSIADYIVGAAENGRVEVVSILLDSDGDGIADLYDAFPMGDEPH